LDALPFVSVIVPVYNSAAFIEKLLDSLLAQDYPEDKREFIIVDNNSKDDTKKIISRYPFIPACENVIQSSYAARNKGIAMAKGDITAFTDADCRPVRSWLSEGVKTMLETGADLVAGEVEFVYSEKPTAAEVYDSITHMQMESEVKEKGVAPTANLFVRSEMFDKIGLFDSRVKSGGDTQWTRKATSQGYRLVYSGQAVVEHPTRNFSQFVKKIIRTGAGSAHARLANGHSLIHEFFYMPYAVFFKIKLDKELLRERFNKKSLAQSGVNLNAVFRVGRITNMISNIAAMFEIWRILALILLRKYEIKSNGK
jgi:glycosyltransferase involved in cell wall biosynthesis